MENKTIFAIVWMRSKGGLRDRGGNGGRGQTLLVDQMPIHGLNMGRQVSKKIYKSRMTLNFLTLFFRGKVW